MARTSKTKAIFQHPFTLGPAIGELPAGEYDVEIDEEEIGRYADRAAFRRVAAYLFVKSGASVRMVVIDPKALDEALKRDSRASY